MLGARGRRRAGGGQRRPRPRRRHAPALRRGVRRRRRSRRWHNRRRVRLRGAGLTLLMQIDVFTLLPHAFAWITEQRPVAAVLGDELELRLVSYRDYTPLRAGQVDDEPYGGGAGMVLRVDVVAAALEAVYGPEPGRRVIAFTPRRPSARPGAGRGARGRAGADAALVPLRGLRRARARAPRDRQRLDRAVRPLRRRAAGDGRARRRGAAAAGRARQRGVAAWRRASRPSSTEAWSTRTTRAPRSSAAGACRRCCSQAITGELRSGDGRRAAPVRARDRPVLGARRGARRVPRADRHRLPARGRQRLELRAAPRDRRRVRAPALAGAAGRVRRVLALEPPRRRRAACRRRSITRATPSTGSPQGCRGRGA